jgi:D-serine deaminase-like pyridoxal phosphate-dependent protein
MRTFSYYRQALKDVYLPAAFVDLDYFESNIQSILQAAGHLPIRVASKSVRCVELLKQILSSSPRFRGVMSFSAREAVFLVEQGFTDILVGYPCVNQREIALVVEANHRASSGNCPITLMVDCPEHLEIIDREARKLEFVQPVCVDIDMSSRFPLLHFGVFRSPIDSAQRFRSLLSQFPKFSAVRLEAIMGYEAQIAGVGDAAPGSQLKNSMIRLLKKSSIKELTTRRQELVQLAIDGGFPIRLVNGGGTGSIRSTIQDSSVSEITVGSGFFSPALFDRYTDFRYQPAMGFALEIVRQPAEQMWTLAGGGYIASGSISADKQPVPYLPEGIRLVANEGLGEVQTPFTYSGDQPLRIGDPVLFRHAKAGELCERFNELHLIRHGTIVQSVPTYRGQHQCFL